MNVEELDTLAEAIERQRADAADVPFPLPAPLDREHDHGRWTNTRAVDEMVWGHVELGARRYASRLEMIVALRAAEEAGS